MSKKLAIIGGGITGLTCAYKLQEKYQITLFEKENEFGGQAKTVVSNGIPVESAVSVLGKLTYTEFYKLMNELAYKNLKPYKINGFHAHHRNKTRLYIDTNLHRQLRLLPKYLLDSPASLLRPWLLISFFNRLHSDYLAGKLDNVLVPEAYKLYPEYENLITTVLTILGLITAVEVEEVTIEHILNFIFDFDNNDANSHPTFHLLKMFRQVQAAENGVSEYIRLLKSSSKGCFIKNTEIIRVKRNQDSTLTVIDKSGHKQVFDKVIIATQPFHIAAFLECKDGEEERRFAELSTLTTSSLVTNHIDAEIFQNIKSTKGLVDYRLDGDGTSSQVTISRKNHYYTAQTLPKRIQLRRIPNSKFIDTAISKDNYSIKANKILSQHIQTVPHITPQTSKLFDLILKGSGEDNLHFACAALSNYPTSQEGGVRSALRVIEELI